MKKYITEFIGTFFLVFTISMTVTGKVPMAPLAIGCSLMIMVYMGGHISGGHYNPAVSLAVLLRGKMGLVDFPLYILYQCAGAIAAAATCGWIRGSSPGIHPGAGVGVMQALATEALYTFALALVVLNTATAKKTEGNSFYGLAIGFTIVVAAFAGGDVSGGAFNPAVGTGLTVWHELVDGSRDFKDLWIYWAGPMAGGVLAAMIFFLQGKGGEA